MRRLDRDTVLAVENTAPGACQTDADHLYPLVECGKIFREFDEQERIELWVRLCSATTNCLVPSLYTFFENCKYLQAAADGMKRLMHLERRETIRSVLERGFHDTETPEDASTCMIQISASSHKLVPANGGDRFDLQYRQLWLYALREFPDMPAKGKQNLAGPKRGSADENVVFNFAHLAHSAGFRTPEIDQLLQRDPDREMAGRLLTAARKSGQYKYDDLQNKITQVVDIIRTAQLVQSNEGTNGFRMEENTRPSNRSGMPAYWDQHQAKATMFLNKLHAPIERQGSSLSSFFILRSIYFSFFGKELSINLANLNGSPSMGLHDLRGQSQGRSETHQPPSEHERQRLHELAQQQAISAKRARDERDYEARLEHLRRETQEQEGRLQLLAKKQQEHQAETEQLQSTCEAKLVEVQVEEERVRAMLANLRDEESEQKIRLEQLNIEEQEKRNKIGQLEQTQRDLEGQVERSKHIAATEMDEQQQRRLEQLAKDEKEYEARLEHLRCETQGQEGKLRLLKRTEQSRQARIVTYESDHNAKVSKAQNELQKLEADKKTRQEDLERFKASIGTKQQELQSAVDDLSTKVRKLTEEQGSRQAEIAPLIKREKELQRDTDNLSAKKLDLTRAVKQLELRKKELEIKISQVTTKNKEHTPRIELERQVLIDRAVARETEPQPIVAVQLLQGEQRQNLDARENSAVTSAIQGNQWKMPSQDDFPRDGAADQTQEFPEASLRVGRLTGSSNYGTNGKLSAATQAAGVESSLQIRKSANQISDSAKVCINFKSEKNKEWVVSRKVLVDSMDPSEVTRVAVEYLRKGVGIFNSKLRMLKPDDCYEKVTSDGTNAIYLRPNWESQGGSLVRLREARDSETGRWPKRVRTGEAPRNPSFLFFRRSP